MPSPRSRPPLSGRGVLLAADFCRATGLEEAVVAEMVRSGSLEGLLDRHGRLFGLFDDVLPSAVELRARGHVVDEAYDADLLRSHEVEDDPDEADLQGDVSSTWEMRWPD